MFKYGGVFIAALALFGCGGEGGSSSDAPAQQNAKVGQFKDSSVSGISYRIGSETKITGEEGLFYYQENDTIEFEIGSLRLGKSIAKPFLTPLDLTAESDPRNPTNIKIVRVLMGLDDDGNPENGIQISEELISYLTSELDMSHFSFSDDDLSVLTTGFSYQDKNGNTRTLDLPNSEQAIEHFEETLRCNTAGVYAGEVNHSIEGEGRVGFILVVDPADLDTHAFIIPISEEEESFERSLDYPYLTGKRLNLFAGDKTIDFTSEDGDSFSFTTRIVNQAEVAGEWDYESEGLSGTLEGEKQLSWELQGEKKYVGLFTRTPSLAGLDKPTGIIQFIEYEDNHLRIDVYDIETGMEHTTESRMNEDGSYSILIEHESNSYSDYVTISLPKDGNLLQTTSEGEATGAEYNFNLSSCRL
ncbi:TPA: hypothetical protein ACN4AY_004653 [Vibrio parahaemolyticus]